MLDIYLVHFQNGMWVSDKTNGEVVLNMNKSIGIWPYNEKQVKEK